MSLRRIFRSIERDHSSLEDTFLALERALKKSKATELLRSLPQGFRLSLSIPSRSLGDLLLKYAPQEVFGDYFREDPDEIFLEGLASLLRFSEEGGLGKLEEGVSVFYDFLLKYHDVEKFSPKALNYLETYFSTREGYPQEDLKIYLREALENYLPGEPPPR